MAAIVLLALFLYLSLRVRSEDDADWLHPWLLATQLANPLAWRWGSVLALGVGERLQRGAELRRASWGILIGILLLWLSQQTPIVRVFGFHHWTDLHRYGVVTFYWLLLALV
jgi:hypothetical protein